MEKIKISENNFNKIIDYINNFLMDNFLFSEMSFSLNYYSSIRIFGKNINSKYYDSILKNIFKIFLDNDIIIKIDSNKYKFKDDKSINIKKFLLDYFEIIDNKIVTTYNYVCKYINSLGINYLITRKNLFNYLDNTPCIYNETYVDSLRNYLEKSGYLKKAFDKNGKIILGSFYIQKLIPSNLTLNKLKNEYKNSFKY